MKAYLFDTANGLYEGEIFEEADMLRNENGLTTIPPPDYEHRQVPVFDCERKTWTVMPIDVARQLLKISATDTAEKTS